MPGTFDPITNGHLALIERAARMFAEITVGVYAGDDQKVLFSASERVRLITDATAQLGNVSATIYSGLTVDFAKQLGVGVLVRGIRVQTDFNYELSLAHMNQALSNSIETCCLIGSQHNAFISSSLIREVALLGKNVAVWVPPNVAEALADKIGKRPC